jgi:hypothetical protein
VLGNVGLRNVGWHAPTLVPGTYVIGLSRPRGFLRCQRSAVRFQVKTQPAAYG